MRKFDTEIQPVVDLSAHERAIKELQAKFEARNTIYTIPTSKSKSVQSGKVIFRKPNKASLKDFFKAEVDNSSLELQMNSTLTPQMIT